MNDQYPTYHLWAKYPTDAKSEPRPSGMVEALCGVVSYHVYWHWNGWCSAQVIKPHALCKVCNDASVIQVLAELDI